KPVLFLSDPDLIRDVLVKDFHVFHNRRDFRTGADPLVDNMVHLTRDDQWKRIRTAMSPTFATGKLKKMLPQIVDCRNTLHQNLDQILTKLSNNTEMDVKRVIGAYAMEVIIRVNFGVKVSALSDDTNPILMNVRKIFHKNMPLKLWVLHIAPKLGKYLKIEIFDTNVTKFFKDFTLNIIEKRNNESNGVKSVDFLQLMLDSMDREDRVDSEERDDKSGDQINSEKYREIQALKGSDKRLTSDEIIAQCILFFIAGYETTTSTLCLCLHNIAKHPAVQQRLYTEVIEFYRQNSQNDQDYDSLNTLKYLDAVIQETQRLYPAAIFVERVPNRDYQLRGTGITIEKDRLVHVPIYAIHRDPDNFPNPDEFDPDRFLAPNVKHHPYTYLPFGAGPRNCVGMRLALMEIKLALVSLVHRYKFKPSNVCYD
ncbi:unnamed protein product, partial [Oppiella nova]